MRILKLLIVGLLLAIPGLAAADAGDIPGASTWYLHVDLDEMRSDEVGKALYGWVDEEIFSEIDEETGVNLGEELNKVTAYSLEGQGPVFLFEGNISQESRDLVMTFIAAEGDLQPMKSSGKSYYRLAAESNEDGEEDDRTVGAGDIEFQIETLQEESWISLDLKNKVIVTASEEQMKAMLASGGKIKGGGSQESRDLVMTFIAAEGDLQPMKSSGKSYYRLAAESNEDGEEDDRTVGAGDIEFQIETLQEESWISLDLKNKVIVTASEEQMKAMLASGGKINGGGNHKGALLVLTAEKALLQAGMNSSALGEDDDGDSDWDSNILRNTEQVAILVAAVANKLAIEIELITTEPEMAESLASVARGLISLVSFDDSMDDDAIAVLRSTKVEAKGNSLNLSLAIDPSLVVATLGD